MQPIIKWPGGKTRELQEIMEYIPRFDRYAEPFMGGGALFFHLCPERALLNDIFPELICFYRLVQAGDAELKSHLYAYAKSFARLRELSRGVDFCGARQRFLWGEDPLPGIAASIAARLYEEAPPPVLCRAAFHSTLVSQMADKLRRTLKIHGETPLSGKDMKENLVTGLLSGYYIYFRNVYNDLALGRVAAQSEAYRAANFYFIREFCYGAMFRYNRRGEFNIPYGGMSYNGKNLFAKIEALFAPQTAEVLKLAAFHCMDFQEFMAVGRFSKQDFLFLDPPYDSGFSAYGGRKFGLADQRRLAEALRATKARFLMVIQETAPIRQLYEGRFRIISFPKLYTYNVRGRNRRDADHLIITNME